jgi:hypothetical protein
LRLRRYLTFTTSHFVDPSGGSSDGFTLAIAHREPDGFLVLDYLRETRAPFQPECVVAEFCQTLMSYRVGRVVGDRYAGEWPREQFSKRNIEYIPSERVKSDIYRDVLPLLNSRRVQLLDDRRIISQFHGLERRTARGGKDSVDHGPGHHDVANAVAGAIVLASHHVRPLNFHPPTLGPPRSEWIAAAGFGGPGGGLPISMADGMGVPSDKPGGW